MSNTQTNSRDIASLRQKLCEPHFIKDDDFMRTPDAVLNSYSLMRFEREQAASVIQSQSLLIARLKEALEEIAGAIECSVGIYDQSIPSNTPEEFASVPIVAVRRLAANAKIARTTLQSVVECQ